MGSLLRRVKTTIHASSTPTGPRTGGDGPSGSTARDNSQTYSNPAVKEARRANSPIDLSSSPYSVHLRQEPKQQQHTLQNPFAEIRKRLARKASVFSLRGKGKANNLRDSETRKTKNRAIAHLQKELPEPPSPSVCSSPSLENKEDRSGWDTNSSRSTVILSGDRPANYHSTNLDSLPSPPKSKQGIEAQRPVKAPVNLSVTPPFALHSLQETIRLKQRLLAQEGYIQRSNTKDHESVSMAAENAAPPIPYARMQELTISACEKALSSVSSYNHAATEDWNTTIINTILGNLVSETTPASDKPSSAQPQFKYVVNSTIIQHAPTSSGGSADPAVTGRRGMHAASGAYWNNDKDGMWSYKYSAAVKKGLDVVVGIIWIWVG